MDAENINITGITIGQKRTDARSGKYFNDKPPLSNHFTIELFGYFVPQYIIVEPNKNPTNRYKKNKKI